MGTSLDCFCLPQGNLTLGSASPSGFLARSAAAVRLATGSQFAEVGATAFGGHRAALAPQYSGCGQLGLRDEIVSEGERRTEEFAAFGGAVFGKRGSGKDQVGFGNQPF